MSQIIDVWNHIIFHKKVDTFHYHMHFDASDNNRYRVMKENSQNSIHPSFKFYDDATSFIFDFINGKARENLSHSTCNSSIVTHALAIPGSYILFTLHHGVASDKNGQRRNGTEDRPSERTSLPEPNTLTKINKHTHSQFDNVHGGAALACFFLSG